MKERKKIAMLNSLAGCIQQIFIVLFRCAAKIM